MGKRVKYIVKLTSKERESLTRPIKAGKTQAYRIKHASILLAADTNGPNERDKGYRCLAALPRQYGRQRS